MTVWITDVEGVSNFRDLSSSKFPAGLVYRSADLSLLTPAGLDRLSHYVSTIIDIRSVPEIRRNGTAGPLSHELTASDLARRAVTRVHAPIFLESDYSPLAIAARHKMYRSGTDGFLDAYRGILTSLGPTLRTLFRHLARRIQAGETRGVLVHCSAGKDRTGVICGLLLLLAGHSPQDVAQEYALTTQGLALQHDRILRSLGPEVSVQDKETAKVMMSSEAIVMRRTVEIIQDEYGGHEKLIQRHVDSSDFMIVRDFLRTNASKL